MKKEIDKKRIEDAVKEILFAIGENPEREGLKETPQRVARMYEEVFEGVRYSNKEIAQMFNKCFTHEGKDIVLVRDISPFSYCEHHMALMYNMSISVAYIPNGKVIGLSKIARIVDMVTKRLQLQEKIGTDILEIMQEICNTEDVAVYIEGEHSCMTARGINKPGAKTRTFTLGGKFETDRDVKEELFNLLK